MRHRRVPPRVRLHGLAQAPLKPRVRLDRGHRLSLAQAPHVEVVDGGLAHARGGDGDAKRDAGAGVVADGPRDGGV